MLQVSEDTQLAVRDNGADLFQGMMTGDGRFLLETPASNTGDGIVKMSSTIDSIGDDYTMVFTQANAGDPITYSVSGAASGVVATGTYQSGEAIAFNGISIEIAGAPVPMAIAIRLIAQFGKMSSNLCSRLQMLC